MKVYSRIDPVTHEETYIAYNLKTFRRYEVNVMRTLDRFTNFNIGITVRDYPFTSEPERKFQNYRGRRLFNITKRLTELSPSDINRILKNVNHKVLDTALGFAIVALYNENPHVVSPRYRKLLQDYDKNQTLYDIAQIGKVEKSET